MKDLHPTYLPIIPVVCNEEDDEIIHTYDHPLCDDPTCPCHRDEFLLALQELQDVPSYVERFQVAKALEQEQQVA